MVGEAHFRQEIESTLRRDADQGCLATLAEYSTRWPDHAHLVAEIHAEILKLAPEVIKEMRSQRSGDAIHVSEDGQKDVTELARRSSGEPPLTTELDPDAVTVSQSTIEANAQSDASCGNADQLGPYRLIKEIGRGGQGVVYLAHDPRLGRNIALKVLYGSGPRSRGMMRRFQREAELTSRLEHPGICVVYESGLHDQTPFIAMRLVDGLPLSKVIHGSPLSPADTWVLQVSKGEPSDSATQTRGTAKTLPSTRSEIERYLHIFLKVALALHAAHKAGVIHRDIKPANIMVADNDEPVLMDFGLAREDGEEGLTISGDLMGTPSYMSPEQLASQRIPLDGRTDVYSLGASLFEALTGRPPFEAPTRAALYQAIMTKEPADPRGFNSIISRDLRTVITAAMEKDRDRRYQSATLFADDLKRIIDGAPPLAKRVGPAGRFLRWTRREPSKAGFLIFALLTLPLLAVLVTSHFKDAKQREEARLIQLQQDKNAMLSKASYELSQRSADKALALYERALSMEGTSPEAAGGLVLTHLRRNDPDAALSALERFGDAISGTVAHGLLRADILRAKGESKAADDLETSLPAPSSAFDHQLLAERALSAIKLAQTNRSSEESQQPAGIRALHHVNLAILLSRPTALLLGLRAQAASHAKDRAAAVETARALRNRWKESPIAHFWAGYAFSGVDELDQTIRAYREATRLDPKLTKAYYNLGIAFSVTGEIEEAIKSYREAIRLAPKWPDAHYNLAIALGANGETGEAIKSWGRAIRLGTKYHEAHVGLGDALKGSGANEAAIRSYREAIRLAPEHADAHFKLGIALERRGATEEAIESYREAVRLDSKDTNASKRLSLALERRGRFESAIKPYREATRNSPRSYEAHRSLLIALAKWKRWNELHTEQERWADLGLSNARREDSLASTIQRISRGNPKLRYWDPAIIVARNAVQLSNSRDPKKLLTLAGLLERAGQTGEAVEIVQKVVALISNQETPDSEVLNLLKDSLKRLNKVTDGTLPVR